ncbi:MAG: hypothetical protein JWO38_4 [Gemmataceae bacterium]|nr:hypothetical protein [Gemmataceae bacterium]
MARRLLMLCLLAVFTQLASGCYCVRQRIANRWHYFHGAGCGACCTPAFRVPTPGPVFHGPPMAGCPSCYTPPEGGPVVYGGPIAGPGGIPIISPPMPLLHGPTIEPPAPGIPSPMPPKAGN